MHPRPITLSRDFIKGRLGEHFSLLGKISDVEISATLGISRTNLILYRRFLGIERFRRPIMVLSPLQRRQVAARLKRGTRSHAVAGELGVSHALVLAVARELGVSLKSRKREAVGTLTRKQICKLLRQRIPLRDIGDLAGVSGERIRQIGRDAGIKPRMEEISERASRRRARRLARLEKQHQRRKIKSEQTKARNLRELARFLRRAQRMWDRELSIRSIAAAYGIAGNSMAWWIHQGRSQLGWFPYRQTGRPRKATTNSDG